MRGSKKRKGKTNVYLAVTAGMWMMGAGLIIIMLR